MGGEIRAFVRGLLHFNDADAWKLMKRRGALVVAIFGALFVLLVVVPAMMSLAYGDGAVCFADSSCPLSAINPCVRHSSFAVVGRCAFAIR
jgi:hypothetical protein